MRTILTSTALAATLLLAATPLIHAQSDTQLHTQIHAHLDASLHAQQSTSNIAPSSARGETAAAPTWTQDQLLTSTDHQAWLLSNKHEATFFERVTQLAEISAKNRNLELPESADAGRRVGQQIKLAAKSDTGQLLFAVVDAAVRKVGKPLPVTAGQ